MLIGIMDPSTMILVGATIAFLVVLFFSNKESYKNLPPGPRGLPFIGNILMFQRTNKLDIDLINLSKQYKSSIILLKIGSYKAFVLNSYDVVKKALVDKADYFSERPMWLTNKTRHAGIIFNKDWSDRRRFTLASMRDFGLGKKSLEERMQEEAGFLIEEIDRHLSKVVDMTVVLPFVTANIICSIIIGNRFDLHDEELKVILQAIRSQVGKSGIAALQRFVPIVKHLPVKPAKIEGLSDLVKRWKTEHEQTFDPDNIRDLVDLFIAESRDTGSAFGEDDLMITIIELFVAGMETTSTTLGWALLFLIHNPDMQERCQEEIKRVLGSRAPVYTDIKDMPYTNGFMNEVQRIANIAPTAVWHSTKANTELEGYTIPRDSVVILNMRSVLRDPKYFTNPDKFDPRRWIDDNEKAKKVPAFIPFSIGKRVCLGEQLAKKEYFIFLVSMLQNFKFAMVDQANPPSLDGVKGAIRGPGNFELKPFRL